MTEKLDDDILFHAYRCSLLTREHLARLTGRNPKSLNESLRRLCDAKLLYRKRKMEGVNSSPYIYAAYPLTRSTFEHDLDIADIYTALYLTGELEEWDQPKEKQKDELNHDTSFSLRFNGRSIWYYLEYETGKNNGKQILSKYHRYLERRKTEPFNVLFVLKNERGKKIKSMIDPLEEWKDEKGKVIKKGLLDSDPKKSYTWLYFMFTTLPQLSADPLGKVCSIAYDSNKYSLLPNLVK
jgi:hypothetical protein